MSEKCWLRGLYSADGTVSIPTGIHDPPTDKGYQMSNEYQDLIERLEAHPWAAHDGLRKEAAKALRELTEALKEVESEDE